MVRVELNDRKLGLYVLKEGFDSQFLGRYFKDTKGNLYDGGFLTDVNTPLRRSSGEGEKVDHADLKADVLEALLPQKASTYDVSAPERPTIRP